ncbi:MAG: hypothetical protein KDA93_09560 [Planctomycetaceae bacterium]|nr:hypothetical protein [Planctomycetaceae bacterium]
MGTDYQIVAFVSLFLDFQKSAHLKEEWEVLKARHQRVHEAVAQLVDNVSIVSDVVTPYYRKFASTLWLTADVECDDVAAQVAEVVAPLADELDAEFSLVKGMKTDSPSCDDIWARGWTQWSQTFQPTFEPKWERLERGFDLSRDRYREYLASVNINPPEVELKDRTTGRTFDSEIDELLALVPPPTVLVHPGSEGEWNDISSHIEEDIPEDLVTLSLYYGSGWFQQGFFSMGIHNVFRPHFAEIVQYRRMIFESSKKVGQAEGDGVIEIGSFEWDTDDQGGPGHIWWRVEAGKDEWPIMISCEFFPKRQFDMPLIPFLLKLFRNELSIERVPFFTDLAFRNDGWSGS